MNVIESSALGKCYRGRWALRDCTVAVPGGCVVALVGPNGAGKSTLLHLSVGLTAPSAGQVRVLGGAPAGSAAGLAGIAFVAQDAPLYKNLSVADSLHLARCMNRGWDHGYATARLAALNIPLRAKAGHLSGGQQAQLALTLALARHPQLLILDEPLASLDPLARYDFMAAVMAAVADDGLSVVLSSHLLAELDRVADYLIVLTAGRVQVAGSVEELLAGHVMLSGPARQADELAGRLPVVQAMRTSAQARLLVRADAATLRLPYGWQADTVGLEELTMAYLRAPDATALPGPARRPVSHAAEVNR